MNIYPVTIIQSRYSGSYEGGEWVAFNCHAEKIPEGAEANNIEAREYWGSAEANLVGRGDSPDAALADLIRRYQSDDV